MIELAQRDSDFPGKINQRYRERGEGNHEEQRNPAFVLNMQERAREPDDHHHGYRDAGDNGPGDRPVHHRGPPEETWKISLEPPSCIVFRDRVQDDRSIDYSVQTGNQYGNERRQRPQEKRRRGSLRNDMR